MNPIMNTMSYRNPKGAIQETRSRAAELYFNGACLVIRHSCSPIGKLHLHNNAKRDSRQ